MVGKFGEEVSRTHARIYYIEETDRDDDESNENAGKRDEERKKKFLRQ